jgi:3-phosphoshikimate 1-carboxyvinyltransferase
MLLKKNHFEKNITSIRLPRAKSLVIRYMIWHFLRSGEVLAAMDDDAEDVKVTHRALWQIRKNRDAMERVTVDVADCGAAFRFLLPLLALRAGKWHLIGTARLLQRPIIPLLNTLKGIGGQIVRAADGSLLIEGCSLQATQLSIDCTLSSQFASALLLSSKELGLQELQILPPLPPSDSYIAMTRQVLADYAQHGGLPAQWESDWSAALFWYAWALLNDSMPFELPALSLISLQGDCRIATLFAQWGIESVPSATGILLKRNNQKISENLTLDLSQNIDLAPIMAALAVLLPANFTLTGIANLNYKESERGNRLVEAFRPCCRCEYRDHNTLIINGLNHKPITEPLRFDAANDHRLAMAFSLFSSRYTIEIAGGESVKKSYPNLL